MNSINTNRVTGATYLGLRDVLPDPARRFRHDMYIELFGAIENLLDEKPPIAPGGGGLGGSNYPTNPVFFDTFGARFRSGVRVIQFLG